VIRDQRDDRSLADGRFGHLDPSPVWLGRSELLQRGVEPLEVVSSSRRDDVDAARDLLRALEDASEAPMKTY